MWGRGCKTAAVAAACLTGLVLGCWCSLASAATLKVTTTADGLAPPGGGCSLREAVEAVEHPGTSTACGAAGSGSNTITLPAGNFGLSVPPSGPDDDSTGDLDLAARAPVEIVGHRRGATVIDAAGIDDRVLSISGPGPVTLSRLTITGGHAPTPLPGPSGTGGVSCLSGGAGGDGQSGAGGGGIYNAGTLTLNRVIVTQNAAGAGGAGGPGASEMGTAGCPGGAGGAGGGGGGIFNLGRLSVTESTIFANRAGSGGTGGSGGEGDASGGGGAGSGGGGGGGGGIYNQGRLSVTRSTLSGNRAGTGGQGGSAPASAGAAAGGDGGSGGAIFSISGPLAVTNSTLASNFAGSGGGGAGRGGAGGSGGGIRVTNGPSTVLNATVAGNAVGAGGSSTGSPGMAGSGGGLSVSSPLASYDMRLQNTIVASNAGSGCAPDPASAIADGGHNLSFGDRTCPGGTGNPRLGPLADNGGPTETMALRSRSAAVDRAPQGGAGCPASDQRGVRRPRRRRCDIGAFEFALPTIRFISPRPHGSYERGSRVVVRFRCGEGGLAGLITKCRATRRAGSRIDTRALGPRRLTVTAVDRTGHRTVRSVRYSVWAYVNPLRAVHKLARQRIDMGVDYGGFGPVLALGSGRVVGARNDDSGPTGCLGDFCWPGGIVIYRLTDGPFAGKYVYVAENITVSVKVGELVRPGQRVAVLHPQQPDMETGWASSHIGRPLAIIRHDECPCGDPGGWSTIEGRNFNHLLVALGAPSGHLQPNPPTQSMPPNWPRWP